MPNHVEGYDVRLPGEVYLPGSEFDPAVKFANAGDPEAAGRVEAAKQPAPEPAPVVPEVKTTGTK